MDATKQLIIPNDVQSNSEARFESHFNEPYEAELGLGGLIEFSDFSDLAKILSKNNNNQSNLSSDSVKEIILELNRLVHVRNRICHSRPLEYNDINDLTEFAIDLKSKGETQWWRNISEALENLNNPSFALSLQIPCYWQQTTSNVYNNLPLPEFDDTGFLGRKDERSAINDLLYSHTRVISLVGEGGVGKTALALRCLYDVLENSENSEKSQYDMIIWVTLKANKLTVSGVVQLRDAIVTALGLYQNIGEVLGVNSNSNLEELLDEISIYMAEFNILLCIDNLETLGKQNVRKFLAGIPEGSKVLITTRIGLGEIEYRYKLDSLDSKASIDLIRKLTRLLNIEVLQKKNNNSLSTLAKKLHNNPLLIKWYVLSLGSGKSREDLLNKDKLSYQDALKFCFQNLYDRLSEVELDLIQTVACLRNNISAVELRFILSDRDELEIAEALHSLNNSSMLKSELTAADQDGSIRKYALTDIASDYLSTVSPVDDSFYSKVREKNKELKRHLEKSLAAHNHYHLDVTNIHASNKDEKICAVYLKQALNIARTDDDSKEALELVKKAKSMMPDFSECYRINAFLLHKSPYKAESEYEAAIEHNSNSTIAYYAYSQFLMQDEEYESALEKIDCAIELEKGDSALLSYKAWILTRSGDYPAALILYEDILPKQSKNEHRKFRISTYQQIVSCYRRYAERLLKDHDYSEATLKIERALTILEEVFNTANYDDRIFNIFGKLLVDSDKVDFENSNVVMVSRCLDVLGRYEDTFSFHNKLKLSSELSKVSEWLHSESKFRVGLFSQELRNGSSEEAQLYHGVIKEIVCKSGVSVSYGFITGDDKEEYFFHRGEINSQTLFHNTSEHRGRRVSFCAHSEKKGMSAKNVKLI
jgi:LuxR family glucitol operon transcriptional activator